MSTIENSVDVHGGDSVIEIVDVGSGNSGNGGNGDGSDVKLIVHTKSWTALKSEGKAREVNVERSLEEGKPRTSVSAVKGEGNSFKVASDRLVIASIICSSPPVQAVATPYGRVSEWRCAETI